MSMIQVKDVSKCYKIYRSNNGWLDSVKSLFSRPYELKRAVSHLSFEVGKGELVGFIGPNGAGKSTTVKMLSGILTPTEGSILVDGLEPGRNRKETAMRIGVVFGQRSQLYWDLPMEDTFQLYQRMYRIEPQVFRRNVDFFVELLQMQGFFRTPVRQLSLGQKMRANLATAMLHDPSLLYLDEPTIGLDVVAKASIRKFLRELNAEKQTTVILTTHDMDDIEEVCGRLMMIDGGSIIFDGKLSQFKEQYSGGTVLEVDYVEELPGRTGAEWAAAVEGGGLKIAAISGRTVSYLFQRADIPVSDAIHLATRDRAILDLRLKEPELEKTIGMIYERKGLRAH
ncbi:ATP-binding cassette domain-containing protein [Paenibacillus sp. GCM10027627]|uniref:ABC transporter ATP-binding protein n=1 Tax=unclassified Paenibacillus TaxID=185978 RepID=UPI003632D6A8